jgi:hypothetical protein
VTTIKAFFANIGSLSWWLSVVVVGVLINLASAYIKSRLDATLSKTSAKWRARSEAQKVRKQRQLEKLRGNPTEQILMSHMALRDEILSLAFLVIAVMSLVIEINLRTTPTTDPLWWPFGPITITRLMPLFGLASLLGFSLCSVLSVRCIRDAREKFRLVSESRRAVPLPPPTKPPALGQ